MSLDCILHHTIKMTRMLNGENAVVSAFVCMDVSFYFVVLYNKGNGFFSGRDSRILPPQTDVDT